MLLQIEIPLKHIELLYRDLLVIDAETSHLHDYPFLQLLLAGAIIAILTLLLFSQYALDWSGFS